MSKPWNKSYPAHVATDIDVAPFASLTHMLDEALQRHAARPAITSLGRTTSYAELDLMSRRFAAWLQSQGVTKGDRVALMLPNVLPFAVVALGTLRAGAVMVTVNPLYTARELAHQLRDSGAETLVVFEAFTPTVAKALEEVSVKRLVVAGTGLAGMQPVSLPGQIPFGQTLVAGALTPFKPVDIHNDDLAFLQYTGGTTGVSKGAMLRHANVQANVLQMSEWLKPRLPLEWLPGKSFATFLPLYHIFALTFCLFYGLRNGMHNIFVANPRDLPGAARELGGRPIHVLPGVNTLFGGLAQHKAVLDAINLKELRMCVGGGTAVQQGVAERWLAATGVPIAEGYGLSETSPCASVTDPTAQQWSGTIGFPVPNTDMAILDDDGQEVAVGERGEIGIRGPQVMAGYWQRPEETAKVMTVDGYFKTGDVGVMDSSGAFKIVDRKKDMILVSGFNVFPNEIEDVVSTLPGVLESAAIGVPDQKSGESVKLFVVKSDPALTVERVLEHCKQNLTAYKNPRHIEFIDALPKSTVGKVLRRELRA
ncbi:AMP-binding protein [Acidovorax sp.]|uniref:AMP-binding protein n=1 Tax=Acidovorax sp. TaxID=1872122 RepID=UPI00262A93E6|nr:AMP-binding protein [Acidovorax sp.]